MICKVVRLLKVTLQYTWELKCCHLLHASSAVAWCYHQPSLHHSCLTTTKTYCNYTPNHHFRKSAPVVPYNYSNTVKLLLQAGSQIEAGSPIQAGCPAQAASPGCPSGANF